MYVCKQWLVGIFDNYTTRVQGRKKFNPEPKGRGVYHWQTCDDRGQGSYIGHSNHVSYYICYGYIILELCRHYLYCIATFKHCTSF